MQTDDTIGLELDRIDTIILKKEISILTQTGLETHETSISSWVYASVWLDTSHALNTLLIYRESTITIVADEKDLKS